MRVFALTSLFLVPSVAPSPIPQGQNDSASIFKPETLAAVETITTLAGVNGIIAYASPKGDGVLTYGNRSVQGDPITPDVSCYPLSVVILLKHRPTLLSHRIPSCSSVLYLSG